MRVNTSLRASTQKVNRNRFLIFAMRTQLDKLHKRCSVLEMNPDKEQRLMLQ